MASSQFPTRHNFIRPPTPRSRSRSRSRRYTTAAPDTIDEILSTCLNWVLPVLFFCVIIVLVTMLTTYTLVMGRPLPRAFTFVIVITFSLLITITFFTLVAFHIYRYQRVRSMLSQALTENSAHDPPCSCQSSDLLQRSAQGCRAAHSSIPLKKIKSQANLRQDTQPQEFRTAPVALKPTDSFHSSTRVPPSRHSSLVVGENEHSRSSTPQQIPTIILPPSPSFDGRPHPFAQFVSEPPKDDPIYYLPPGPPCKLPSTGIRPTWVDDIEQRIAANQAASTPERRWNFWSK